MKDTKRKHNRKNILGNLLSRHFVFILVLALLFLDQLLKAHFISHSYYLSLFSLHLVKNTGISFGLLQGAVVIMIIVSLLFLLLLWYFREEFNDCKFCLILLAAGTLGNLIDRIFRGYVVDFFDLGWFPVFNLADTMITIGTAGIVLVFLNDIIKDIKRKKSKKRK